MFRLVSRNGAALRNQAAVLTPIRQKSSTTANGIDLVSVGPSGVASGVTVYIRGGSAAEGYGNQGVAHLMKWLAYQTNQKRTALRTQRELAVLGATLDVEVGREAIKFQSTFQKRDLAHVVEMLSGFAVPRLEEYEVKNQSGDQKLRDALPFAHAETRELEASRLHRLVDSVHAAAYGYKGLGADEHLREDTSPEHEVVRRWVRDTYHGKNILIVGVGLEHSELEEVVNNSFDVSPGTGPEQVSFKLTAPAGWPAAAKNPYPVQIPASGSTYSALAWRGPGRNHPDAAKLAILTSALGSSSTTRRETGFYPGSGVTALFSELLAKANLSFDAAHPLYFPYSRASVFGAFIHGPLPASLYVSSLNSAFQQLSSLPDDKLQRAILQYRRNTSEALETLTGQLNFFDSQVSSSTVQTPQAYLAELEALKPEQIREVAASLGKAPPAALVSVGDVTSQPTKKPVA